MPAGLLNKVALITTATGLRSADGHTHADERRSHSFLLRRPAPTRQVHPVLTRSPETVNGPLVVVATIIPNPDHRRQVLAALEDAIGIVHSGDAGCEIYALHEGDDRLVLIEKWDSADAFTAHGGDPEMGELRARLTGLLAAPVDVQVLTPHPAGTAPQGAI